MTSTGIYSQQIRDTSTYSFPDPAVDGGYQTEQRSALVKVVNTMDQAATVTLYGSTFDDAPMNQEVENDSSTSSVSVAAGSSAVLGTVHPWSYIRLEASSGTAPTTGSVKIVFQTER